LAKRVGGTAADRWNENLDQKSAIFDLVKILDMHSTPRFAIRG